MEESGNERKHTKCTKDKNVYTNMWEGFKQTVQHHTKPTSMKKDMK